MRVHVIGLGGAGCRIADRFAAEHDDDPFLSGINAFDTHQATLDALDHLDTERRYRFGDAAGGDGLDGDLHAGRRLGEAHAGELSRAIDAQRPSRVEAFVLVVGLGGAAGGGVAPALVDELARLHDAAVYAVAVLPATRETEPRSVGPGRREERPPRRPLAMRNAARTLSALESRVDAVFPFDNEAWLRRQETIPEAASRLNDVVVTRFAALFGAGETPDGVSTPQQVLDASDVARIVGSEGQIAAIGYADQPVETGGGSRFGLGFLGGSRSESVDASTAVSAIETVIRKAARGKGTTEVPEGRADRTLLVVGGPPAWLNREAIADGRRWLASEAGSDALLSGDAPVPDGDRVFAVVVRSSIDESDRIATLRASIE
ncbi:FtsZ/tubulin family protein [Halorubrum vacuolatum]|uniref:Tubulin-like protein CetZ n=1 Tax=Halorubrum vacuolatum TaxID=63740 RepID=A0A238W431_HALVU|nr:cell division protein FtsZ [Halorubrum vacuolatum]SNR40923.1 Cell division GTPase FtsZ [Halorubrum vacuolatum]